MNPARASAIVLNWRTVEHAIRAVRALVADGMPPERVVVVDNASGDGSVDRFREELPGCRLLALDRNVGFARGNNEGARELPGEAYLFVNSDAFVHAPGSVRRLLDALDDPGVGIAVPRLLNEDLTLQPTVVPASTPLPELVRASGLSRFVPNGLQPSLGTHWDHSESRAIQAAIGPVVAVRGDAWEALRGWDERRFMYAEDLDLFWRARELGWEARFVAEAEFVHLGGASADLRWSDRERAERVARAEAATIRERLPRWRAGLTLALMALGVGGRALFHRAAGNRRAAETMRAWFRGYVSTEEARRSTSSTPRAVDSHE
jgi:N-acetylglucosaminyl-diphospho-decaprenol L-rhamnosyltransferase